MTAISDFHFIWCRYLFFLYYL